MSCRNVKLHQLLLTSKLEVPGFNPLWVFNIVAAPLLAATQWTMLSSDREIADADIKDGQLLRNRFMDQRPWGHRQTGLWTY
jgi:hypothetical protein